MRPNIVLRDRLALNGSYMILASESMLRPPSRKQQWMYLHPDQLCQCSRLLIQNDSNYLKWVFFQGISTWFWNTEHLASNCIRGCLFVVAPAVERICLAWCLFCVFPDSEPVTCNHKDFACASGDCISSRFRCDGDYDCLDNSDEASVGEICAIHL